MPIEPGFLVVFDGTWDGTALNNAELAWYKACPEPRAGGEFARLALEGVGARLEQRAHARQIARRYFEEQSFVEVETPTRLLAPGLDAHVEPIAASGGWLERLRTSFETSDCRGNAASVRACPLPSRRRTRSAHEPEFTMLEWYRAFEPVEAVMRDAERLVRAVITVISGQAQLRRHDIACRVTSLLLEYSSRRLSSFTRKSRTGWHWPKRIPMHGFACGWTRLSQHWQATLCPFLSWTIPSHKRRWPE